MLLPSENTRTANSTKQLGRRLAYLLAALGFIQLAQMFDASLSTIQDILPSILPTNNMAQHRSLRRQLAAASSSFSSSRQQTADLCPLSRAVQPQHPIRTPTPIASYPGSGSKMVWMLVETLTGLATADEHRLNGNPWDRAISIKTHWPHPHGASGIGDMVDQKTTSTAAGVATESGESSNGVSFPRAVLLLRHPLSAIPSLHNFLYEVQTQTRGHTVRAPLRRWQSWQERNFEVELKAWEDHFAYWLDRYGANERLVLTFEGLTDEVEGPKSSVALMDFLSQGLQSEEVGWTPKSPEEMACIWKKMVQYKEEKKSDDEIGAAMPPSDIPPGNARRSGSDYRPYSQDQLGQTADMLRRLQRRYGGDEQVAVILGAYLQRVVETLTSPIAAASFEQQ